MRRTLMAVLIAVMGMSGVAWAEPEAPASAPAPDGSISSRSGHLSLGGALGFTLDPDLFAGQVGADYYITNEVAVGPLFQGGTGGEGQFWGLSGQVKYSAALAATSVVRPYGQVGIGFVDYYINRISQGQHKTTYMFPIGGGFEFELNDHLTLDIGAIFDITPEIFMGMGFGVRYLF